MGEDFAVLLCLFAGEFVVLAADGEVVLVFGLGGLQIGLYARDGGVKILLREFAFPYGDDGSGEGVEALGVEFVTGDRLFLQKSEHNLPKSGKTLVKMRARGLRPPHFSEHGHPPTCSLTLQLNHKLSEPWQVNVKK